MRAALVALCFAATVTAVVVVLWPLLRIARDTDPDVPAPLAEQTAPDPDPVVSLDVRPLPGNPDQGWRIERRPHREP